VQQFNFGGYVDLGFGGWSMSLGLSTTAVSSSDLSLYGFATTGTHTYELVTVVGSGTHDLFIDGVALFTGESLSTGIDEIRVGDGTGTANAAWTLEDFSVTYVVPAPGAAAVFAAAGLAAIRRRR